MVDGRHFLPGRKVWGTEAPLQGCLPWVIQGDTAIAIRMEIENWDTGGSAIRGVEQGYKGSRWEEGSWRIDLVFRFNSWPNTELTDLDESNVISFSFMHGVKDILMAGILVVVYLVVMVAIFIVVPVVAWYHDRCNLDSDGGGDVCHLDGGPSGCILWRRRSTRSVPSWVSIITAAKGQPLINMQVLRVRTRQCSLVVYCHQTCEHFGRYTVH